MNVAILVLNIISGVPILVYPFTIAPTVMMFDSPESLRSPYVWLMFVVALGYPIFIVLCIYFSRTYHSLVLAIIGLLPLLLLVYIFTRDSHAEYVFTQETPQFVCNSTAGIYIPMIDDDRTTAEYVTKRLLYFYDSTDVGDIYEGKYIRPSYAIENNSRLKKLLWECKNSSGEMFGNSYVEISKERENEIIRKAANEARQKINAGT